MIRGTTNGRLLEVIRATDYRYPEVEDSRLTVDSWGVKERAGEARIFQDGSKLLLERPVEGSYRLWPTFKRLFRRSRI